MLITIGIVDDQKIVNEGLALILSKNEHFNVVLQANTQEELFLKLKGKILPPDIILLAIQMPLHSGIETAGLLHKLYPGIKVVAISSFDKVEKIDAMFSCGCVAFLGKSMTPESFCNSLLEIQNETFCCKSDKCIDRDTFLHATTYHGKPKDQLSLVEKVYLKLLCTSLSFPKIALKMKVKEFIVVYYKRRIYQKLNVSNRSELILLAETLGYIN